MRQKVIFMYFTAEVETGIACHLEVDRGNLRKHLCVNSPRLETLSSTQLCTCPPVDIKSKGKNLVLEKHSVSGNLLFPCIVWQKKIDIFYYRMNIELFWGVTFLLGGMREGIFHCKSPSFYLEIRKAPCSTVVLFWD